MSDAGKSTDKRARRDLSARAGSFLAIWGAPILIGVAGGLLAPTQSWAAGVWSIMFFWMGAACVFNARRCGRLHCYFAGPVLLAGATLAGARAVSAFDPGANSLPMIVSVTIGFAALTWALEGVWGKYVRSLGTDRPNCGG